MNKTIKKDKIQTTEPINFFKEQPLHKVPIEEQETIIQFGRKDKKANILTNDPTEITKMKHNVKAVVEDDYQEISRIKNYTIPKDLFTFRSKDRGRSGKHSFINHLSSSFKENNIGKTRETLPRGKVSLEEQETTVRFRRDGETAYIYTSDSTMMTKLDKIYQAVNVDICQGTVCAKWYEIPKRWICFRRKKREKMNHQDPIFVSVTHLECKTGAQTNETNIIL